MAKRAEGSWRSLGNGLYSRVTKDGAQTYRFRAWFEGKLVQIVIGRQESLRVARELAADLRERLRREMLHLSAPRRGVTLEEVLTRRIEDRIARTSTGYHQRMNDAATHLKSILGAKCDALSMNRDDVRGYINRRIKEGAANGTINRELSFGKSSFRAAVLDELIMRNPFDGVEPLPEPEPDDIARVPDEATIGRILEQSGRSAAWLKNLVMVLIGTGERISAVLSLRRRNVDLENRQVIFPARIRKGRRSKRQMRIVPLSEHLLKVLANLVDGLEGDEFLFSRRRVNNNSEALPIWSVRSAWKRACKRAGVIPPRIHDLRHFAVSRLGKAGISSSLTREFIGHKTDVMTRRYMHLNSDDLRPAAEILGTVVGNLCGNLTIN